MISISTIPLVPPAWKTLIRSECLHFFVNRNDSSFLFIYYFKSYVESNVMISFLFIKCNLIYLIL